MEFDIFWPGDVPQRFVELLRKIHRIPWAKVIDYSSQDIDPDDTEGIREFLQTHKEKNQFVYVLPATHVAVVLADKVRAGWAQTDHESQIVAIFHHLPDEHRSHVQPFKPVWQIRPRLPFAEVSLYRM